MGAAGYFSEEISFNSHLTPETPVLKLVDDAKDKGYKRLCIPLTTAKWEARWTRMCLLPTESSDEDKEQAKEAEQWRLNPGFQREEVTITRLDEAEGVIVMISEWLELDAADDWVRHDAEIALKQELAYASYLNVQAAILPAPRNRDHVASYARIVNSCLAKYPYTYLSSTISGSRSAPSLVISMSEQQEAPPADYAGGSLNATWEMWDLIRSIKWAAESVRYIFLPSSTFIANVKGYPHRPTIILAGVSDGHHSRGGEAAYSQYVRHLEKTSAANFAQGYQDYLQAPLQPLMDNLPNPIKYAQYEEACVCVAGAGRGPLRSRRDATVMAVEKNPKLLLQHRQATEWDNKVIDVPEKADILPECLDGAMRFLKPSGISIPSSYTAHLAPLSSSKLYNEARSTKNDKSWRRHTHNARSANLRFYIPHAGILHGLAGYFEAVLYGNIGLSIHPQERINWFPLFFPFKEPLYLPSSSELQVSIWRLTNDRQVWYEWHAESFISIPAAAADRKEELLLGTTFPTSPFAPMASPLIDSKEPAHLDTSRLAAYNDYSASDQPFYEMVKIGHTSLHNPGGRSSWIGL
ncbi:shk1 kinase-binding protein 1 [Pholiota molesta]|nr:shk1 kinase-binding protein 1 [Pholiota molesta]